MLIRRVRAEDAAAIAAIYRDFVEQTLITFELEAPSADEIGNRIAKAGDRYPFIVAEDAGKVVGYAYATIFRDRPAYRFAVETSIYIAPQAQGSGLGRRLYEMLLDVLTAQGFVHAIGAVTVPNAASVGLHRAMGYAENGVYQDVGFKMGEWASVQIFQKTLRPLPANPSEPLALSACGAWSLIPA